MVENVVKPNKRQAWRGVDLDGTLAMYDSWNGPDHVGAPIMSMVARVKKWLARGEHVRIFTARVHGIPNRIIPSPEEYTMIHPTYAVIEAWCLEHIGCVLPITCQKDYDMIELWDDRAVQIEFNTGRRMDGKE